MLSDWDLRLLFRGPHTVLILVLLDYALWLTKNGVILPASSVLILVLLDYALWHWVLWSKRHDEKCLNPCSAGLCSLTFLKVKPWRSQSLVLILVLLDYALWQEFEAMLPLSCICLNPCSAGLCSPTQCEMPSKEKPVKVLILVLLDYALRQCLNRIHW